MDLPALQAVHDRTGAAPAACRAALAEAEGDVAGAIRLLVARGQAPRAPETPPEDVEEALLDAIRARNAARTVALLAGLDAVPPRVLQAALITGAGLAEVLEREIPGLGAAGHATARRIGESPAAPALRGRALGRVLEAMAPGLAREDALRVGAGVRPAAVAPHVPGACTARRGGRFGVAVGDLALLSGGAGPEVRALPSPAAARDEVQRWVGAPPVPGALLDDPYESAGE